MTEKGVPRRGTAPIPVFGVSPPLFTAARPLMLPWLCADLGSGPVRCVFNSGSCGNICTHRPSLMSLTKMRFELGLNSNQRIQARIAEGSKYLRPELAKAARPTTVKWLLMEIG
jgi:hypothetical protein